MVHDEENLSSLFAGPKLLGQHPQTGEEVLLRTGRYGPFLQVGTDKTASAVQAVSRAGKLKASKKPAKSAAKARMVSLKRVCHEASQPSLNC